MGDDLYKREDDRKWRERTEERVVGLTTSEGVQNDRLDELDDEIRTLRAIIEGASNDKDDNGIKGDLHELRVGLNALRAIMQPDSLGMGGVINRLKALEKRESREERDVEYRWKMWLAILGFVSALTVAVVTNLDRIEAFFQSKGRDPVSQAIEKAKRPKGKKIYRTRVVPAPQEKAEDDDVPEMPH